MENSIGKVVTGYFRSAPPIGLPWKHTSPIKRNITVRSRFRMNTAVCSKNTVFHSMNAMCGTESYFALSGLGVFWGTKPRALPWAIPLRPVGASNPTRQSRNQKSWTTILFSRSSTTTRLAGHGLKNLRHHDQDLGSKGLICLNQQSTVPEGFFLVQLLLKHRAACLN